jgi:hypothetical protein
MIFMEAYAIMSKKKRKAIIDDGMNSELVYGADFDGYLGIPLIRKPDKLIIPSDIVPFTKRNRTNSENVAIGFYEMDTEFANVLISPENYIEEFCKQPLVTPESVKSVLSPDCSLYRGAPLAVQISNVYRNRAIGYYYQSHGAYIIPQVQMAGIIHIQGGKIASYDNQSGHYKPNSKSMGAADEAFGKLPSALFKKKKGNKR